MRFERFLRYGIPTALLGLLGWAVAGKFETGRAAGAPAARLVGDDRGHFRAERSHPPMAPKTRPARHKPDIAEICSRIAQSPDPSALEDCYCDAAASWIAAHSHSAEMRIRELGLPRPVRLRLEAQVMAERDFASAFQWADRLPDPDDRISALSSVLYEGALDAPEEVLEFARGIDLGDKKEVVLGTIVERWGRTDREAAGRRRSSEGGS